VVRPRAGDADKLEWQERPFLNHVYSRLLHEITATARCIGNEMCFSLDNGRGVD